MRGDPPPLDLDMDAGQASTPHARGSTPLVTPDVTGSAVYPACAGIHLIHSVWIHLQVCLPRMRGDPPRYSAVVKQLIESTPHARGSTSPYPHFRGPGDVYPACAGIHRHKVPSSLSTLRLPRMRGDPPLVMHYLSAGAASTPHARGSTCPRRLLLPL